MSTIVIFLFSKYVPQVKPYLEIINNIEYIQTLCVDNEKVRFVILQSSLLNIKKVPCFIVINQNKEVFQYTDIATFLQKLIKANAPPEEKRHEKIEKSPIQSVIELENVKDEQPEIREMQDDYIQTNKSYPTNSKPASNQHKQEVKKSNKTSIGEIINYQKEKNEKLKPEPQSERTNISKGKGHEEMGRSSLRDNSPKKAFDVIEDIDEESSTEGLIDFSKSDKAGSEKKEKRIGDIKSLVSEMSDQREEQLKKLNRA